MGESPKNRDHSFLMINASCLENGQQQSHECRSIECDHPNNNLQDFLDVCSSALDRVSMVKSLHLAEQRGILHPGNSAPEGSAVLDRAETEEREVCLRVSKFPESAENLSAVLQDGELMLEADVDEVVNVGPTAIQVRDDDCHRVPSDERLKDINFRGQRVDADVQWDDAQTMVFGDSEHLRDVDRRHQDL